MTHPPLSENYIADYVAKWVLPPPGSVFQVMGTKKIGGDSTNLKYRLCLSDGIHRFSQAMIYLADADNPVPPGNSDPIIDLGHPNRTPYFLHVNPIFNLVDQTI